MSSTRNKDRVAESLSHLSLDTSKGSTTTASKSKKKTPVADSWEDDDESSGSEDELKPSVTSPTVPSAPPPTPYTTNYGSIPGWEDAATSEDSSSRGVDPSKRPEKTDAVARRMIAAGLGLKAPKQTDEQKAYQKSIREQEKKRREQERLEEQKKREDTEKAKAAVWDD
ncbi:hypothetical protein VFPPC_13766 [Pochonia chlamydosporia 170]|uniref:Ubiquitin-like protein smt3 n=1 Tax=Pochonia chlamydosporia 170 TaxID=1380566 RepID=A0A179FV40_METCM|nr:hypothetical protein VFPPC_13766 [Pochonia chlamydosporia 170]OAQ68981.1 hypothetical protein VFPPC_13766 [Pochonia chlamydosporia 170]